MPVPESQQFIAPPEQAGQTLAALLRARLPGYSWSDVRRVIESRRVSVLGDLCLDPARRLKEGDLVEVAARPAARPRHHELVQIRHLDEHLVVVEKPSGICTVRHPAERDWPEQRKALSPALEDFLPRMIAQREGRARKGVLPRLRVVQRLDKDTSGLLVLARTVHAEVELGRQFRKHTVTRRYLAVVPGRLESQRIESRLVRDRGDGRRGSSRFGDQGKEAVTHVEVLEQLPDYALISCRLETGRTHQIRIHLAELGHPLCGEEVYNRPFGREPIPDRSGAPRLALHAYELGFVHPQSGQEMHWTMPLPADLEQLWKGLKEKAGG